MPRARTTPRSWSRSTRCEQLVVAGPASGTKTGPAGVRRAGPGGGGAPTAGADGRGSRARRGERAAHRAARRRLARPAHAAGLDQGVRLEPAPARRRLTPEATHELLATIDEETDRLNRLVGNLLDMSRLQTGALQLSARRSASRRCSRPPSRLTDRPVRVVVDVPESLPRVRADAALLERASPTWSRTPVGRPPAVTSGSRRARSRTRRPPGHRPRPGHPADQREPCSGRSNASATTRTAAGSASVSPLPGASWRRWAASSSSTTRPGAAYDGHQPAGRAVSATRVLVVDDEPQIRRALGINLRARGYDVDLAPRPASSAGSRPAATPTSWCSTSACPASTAST